MLPQQKVGGYAIATSKPIHWTSGSSTPAQTKNKKLRAAPQIINEIFKECSELVSDTYWGGIFSNMAIGKFPRAYSYKDNYLFHKKGARVRSVLVPSSPILAINTCINFFGETSGMMSPNNQEKSKHEQTTELEKSDSIYTCSWDEIDTPIIIGILISRYSHVISGKYKLSESERKQYISVIQSGLVLHQIVSSDIDYHDGGIHNIKGVEWCSKTRTFYIDARTRPPRLESKSGRSKVAKSIDKNSYLVKWVRTIGKQRGISNFDPMNLSEELTDIPSSDITTLTTDT